MSPASYRAAPPRVGERNATAGGWGGPNPSSPDGLDHLVEGGLAGELGPAGLGDDLAELRGGVGVAVVLLGLPVGHVDEAVRRLGADGAVQTKRHEAGLGDEVAAGGVPQGAE